MRAPKRLVGLLALLLLTACSKDPQAPPAADPTACAASVQSLLDVTQRYLNGLESTTTASPASGTPTASAAPVTDQDEFSRAIQDIRDYAARLRCDAKRFESDLTQGLERLRAGGPVARAVLLQLKAGEAVTTPLKPGDDVASAVAAAPAGGTVRLGRGTFVLPETVTLLRGVTLEGAGREVTTLQTSAGGGALLVLTPESVTVTGLGVRRVGSAAGPVISAAPVATLTLSKVRVSGARADRTGQGGVGVLMSGGAGGQTGATRRTSLTVADSVLADNAVAGVVVAGEHRASVLRTSVTGSRQCGICFLGTSDGDVRNSAFSGNAAAVVTAGEARPLVVGGTVTGGEVGIQAIERSAPEVRQVTITGAKRAAMIWTQTARGRLEANRCVQVPFGIVVGPKALPYVGRNDCLVARGRE